MAIDRDNRPCQSRVLTIGNFDGLHLGHQRMLAKTIELAHEQQCKSAVMVFEPMPKEYFTPDNPPARLMNVTESKQVFSDFQHQGQRIDDLFISEFDEYFRSLSAQSFADILTCLNVTTIVLGDDFRFGNDRLGDSEFLRHCGFTVYTQSTITDNQLKNQRISSTRIRDLLAEGDLLQATQLLGRDYYMIGKVEHGDKIGRTLDFPTANVSVDRLKPALHGVFAVDVQLLNDDGQVITSGWDSVCEENYLGIQGLEKESLFGAANIGTRPAVDGLEWRLEVHFPRFKGNLYGKNLKVRFLHYLHGEKNYQGLTELKAGIHQDVDELVNWLTHKKKVY